MRFFDRMTGGQAPESVRDELLALKEPDRRQRAKEAERDFLRFSPPVGRRRLPRGWRAAAVAWVGTATARKIAADFWRIGFVLNGDPQLEDDVYAVLVARGRPFVETAARGLLRGDGGWGSWPLVRRAVRERVIEPPEGDDYIRGLVFGITARSPFADDLASTYQGLLADPELLEREVWQLFEIDVGGELTNAATWHEKEQGKPFEGYTRGDNRWLYALTRLADEQRLDRQRLLDASLDALLRDFRASTVGWYAKLHEELEPSRAERVERVDRYLALVTSPTPVVVKVGLAALREIEDAIPPDAFARVVPTPFVQRQKNLSTEALSLLDRLCRRHPESRAVLLEAAAHALGHDRADVQERALKLLEQHPAAVPRAAILEYVDGVAPTLRPRLEALTGVVAPEEPQPAPGIPVPAQPRATPELVRASLTAVEPVESLEELIELGAMLVEGQGRGDDCERFLDGVSRLCDQQPPWLERRTAGLVARAEETPGWGTQDSGYELISGVVQAWARRRRHTSIPSSSKTIIGFLGRRAKEVGKRAARGDARPLLALPTHSGGWIDPDVLIRRERDGAYGRADPIDRAQARARAFPDVGPLTYVPRIRTSTWERPSRQLRLGCPSVPAELGELGSAAAHGGALDENRTAWFQAMGWGGFDALGVRWALTALPSLPEVAFAAAAGSAVDAGEGSASYHPEVVLEHALDRHVPLGSEAWLATAACLVARSPDLPRVAVDLLVASVEDGRFDAEQLGTQVAWLVDNELAKVSRLEAPLRDVARVSPLHTAQIVRAIEALLAQLVTRPHGLQTLLDVAVQGAAATGRRIVDERARAVLTDVAADASPTSKLGKLARRLLEG